MNSWYDWIFSNSLVSSSVETSSMHPRKTTTFFRPSWRHKSFAKFSGVSASKPSIKDFYCQNFLGQSRCQLVKAGPNGFWSQWIQVPMGPGPNGTKQVAYRSRSQWVWVQTGAIWLRQEGGLAGPNGSWSQWI